MSKPAGTFALFTVPGGHRYFKRASDGAIFLTDDSAETYAPVATDKPIKISSTNDCGAAFVLIPLAGDCGVTPASTLEAEMCIKHLGMTVQLGQTPLRAVKPVGAIGDSRVEPALVAFTEAAADMARRPNAGDPMRAGIRAALASVLGDEAPLRPRAVVGVVS